MLRRASSVLKLLQSRIKAGQPFFHVVPYFGAHLIESGQKKTDYIRRAFLLANKLELKALVRGEDNLFKTITIERGDLDEAFARADRVSGAAFEASPLVRRADTVAFGLGLSWVFAVSGERVPEID